METSDLILASPPEASLRQPNPEDGSTEGDSSLGEVDATSDFRILFEHQKRIFDLAMNASQMGTWRYSIADNICVYDENAQRLYGLTEARFLHDEEGVKSKFHADDMELMWSRVSKALDPAGDGRYDVEYRVKQLDGSWRWLSAWGLVEFEGEGPDRKAVAIVGASRDLTDRKQAEQLQRLLLDELGHRIKNMLARVQAVADQTLKGAQDLPSAREVLNRRICSMAAAHDLLTSRNWSGADLSEVVARALDGFNSTRLDVSGSHVELSERQTLAFSMALHELVTNATKYGALSNSVGTLTIGWKVEGEMLRFCWSESGGPPVTTPGTRGFGSRLLERVVVSDLRGDVELDYNSRGLRCTISAPMASSNSSRDEAEIGQTTM